MDGTAPQHSGMPDSAIATGAVDLIAPVQDMPRLIMAGKIQAAEAALDAATEREIDTARLSICEILRARLGHDFSQYKDKTFLRRVHRRMQVLGLTHLTEYVARLEQAILRRMPWCSRWTKRAKSRRSIGPSRGCRSSGAAAAR